MYIDKRENTHTFSYCFCIRGNVNASFKQSVESNASRKIEGGEKRKL